MKSLLRQILRIPGQVPLRSVLVVPFILQIFGAVGLTGWLSLRNGQQAVNEVTIQLRNEVSASIQQRLQDYLTAQAMPPCFDNRCGRRFDDLFTHKAQGREFRHYLGGLLGESERKNISQIARNTVGVQDHKLHHFITDSPWDASCVNERRYD